MTKQSRRQFLAAAGAFAAAGCATYTVPSGAQRAADAKRRPNILLIMTDDQGYGDVSAHGNPYLKTPNLDRLRGEGVRFERFYVCPVCAPTRAALMTGRYNYRTRVVDTYVGRAMMDPEEVTAAEILGAAGYRTGIFGKWHLGDNYPMRACDKGFQESLVHRGGGLMQPSDWPGNTYFSPMLSHNGKDVESHGYCTDVFTEAAMKFMAKAKRSGNPFFCYLPTNAPHTPLQIDDNWADPFRKMGLPENTARVYGMEANIDWNVGRILDKLEDLGIAEDTLIIFITDNGPQMGGREPKRYNAGMRGAKTTVYEGGIRVPSFWRWPAGLEAGKRIDTMAAHIDILPTLLDIADIAMPENLDGKSLRPLLIEENPPWHDRCYFTQWHRGDVPEPFRACAVVSQRYKLVNGKELYDLIEDPQEKNDIAKQKPDVVAKMRKAYQDWYADVSATRGYEPPRIYVGTEHENPVVLTRQDWRGQEGWGGGTRGFWLLNVTDKGPYDITLTFKPLEKPTTVGFQLAGAKQEQTAPQGAEQVTFKNVTLKTGPAKLDTSLTRNNKTEGAWQVYVRKTQ